MAAILEPLTIPALVALLAAGSLLVVFSDWRAGIAALLLEYAAAAALLTQLVILEVALVKLITGALVVAILTLTGWQLNFGRPAAPGVPAWQARFEVPTALPFRLMAVTMAVVSALYVAGQPQFILPGLDQAPTINAASYLLMALGLLNLGLTEEPLRAGLGLLTLLLGFEIFYAAVEPSLAVVALIAAVELAVALAVSYLAALQYAEGRRENAS
jgi:hypothetical protein